MESVKTTMLFLEGWELSLLQSRLLQYVHILHCSCQCLKHLWNSLFWIANSCYVALCSFSHIMKASAFQDFTLSLGIKKNHGELYLVNRKAVSLVK